MNRAQRRRLARFKLAESLKHASDDERAQLDQTWQALFPKEKIEEARTVGWRMKANLTASAPHHKWHTDEREPSPKIREKLDWIAAGLWTGDIKNCGHLSKDRAQAIFINLWDEVLRCAFCSGPKLDHIQDNTCDFCHTYCEDGLRGHAVQVGNLLVSFGMCDDCDDS